MVPKQHYLNWEIKLFENNFISLCTSKTGEQNSISLLNFLKTIVEKSISNVKFAVSSFEISDLEPICILIE